MARADAISSEALERLEAGDIPGLGRLASDNQALLEALGISNDILRRMVRVADRHSYGSKITGAGGGGCIVAIADPVQRRGDRICPGRGGVPHVRGADKRRGAAR